MKTPVAYPGTFRTVFSGKEKLLSKAFERIRVDHQLPNVTRLHYPNSPLLSARISLDPDEGSGYWEFAQLTSDLYVIATDYQYKHTHEESVIGEGFLEFHFKVSGELLIELNSEDRVSVRGPSLLIWKQPRGQNIRERINGGIRESSFTLYCKPKVFTETLGNKEAQWPPIIKSFIDGKNKLIEYDILPLNPAMAFSITNLLRSNFTNEFHMIHIMSKSYDLLCDILQYLGSPNVHDQSYSKPLSSYEKSRLQEARDILSTTFNPTPTIKYMAKTVGLNETKLKLGFKKQFGTTIHQYSNYHRMQKALDLLQTTDVPISGIAHTMGYEYQTSFTSAVKHFFGVTPKQLRGSATKK